MENMQINLRPFFNNETGRNNTIIQFEKAFSTNAVKRFVIFKAV